MGAINFDHAVHRFSYLSARLVAVGAQVAGAAVIGHALKSVQVDRVCSFQSPVFTGIAHMDGVASAAALAGWVRIAIFNLAGVETCSDHLAEAAPGVTSSTAGAGAAYIRFAGTMM